MPQKEAEVAGGHSHVVGGFGGGPLSSAAEAAGRKGGMSLR